MVPPCQSPNRAVHRSMLDTHTHTTHIHLYLYLYAIPSFSPTLLQSPYTTWLTRLLHSATWCVPWEGVELNHTLFLLPSILYTSSSSPFRRRHLFPRMSTSKEDKGKDKAMKHSFVPFCHVLSCPVLPVLRVLPLCVCVCVRPCPCPCWERHAFLILLFPFNAFLISDPYVVFI